MLLHYYKVYHLLIKTGIMYKFRVLEVHLTHLTANVNKWRKSHQSKQLEALILRKY